MAGEWLMKFMHLSKGSRNLKPKMKQNYCIERKILKSVIKQ